MSSSAQTVLRMTSTLPDGWNTYYTGVGKIGQGVLNLLYKLQKTLESRMDFKN